MAQTYTKVALSGSTDGKMIAVAATATPGTTLHTAHATSLDELYLYANNRTGSAITVTLEVGGIASANHIIVSVPANSKYPLVEGDLVLTNSAVVAAFASAGINISGFVNRIASV